jgi:hypothetical protein
VRPLRSKIVATAVLIAAVFACPSRAAADDKNDAKDHVLTLERAAEELQKTDPALAAKLRLMAEKKKEKLAKQDS